MQCDQIRRFDFLRQLDGGRLPDELGLAALFGLGDHDLPRAVQSARGFCGVVGRIDIRQISLEVIPNQLGFIGFDYTLQDRPLGRRNQISSSPKHSGDHGDVKENG